jgi:CubicO group peptidase (beta-lactamase class C family)
MKFITVTSARILLALTLFASGLIHLNAQNIPANLEDKIDSLFDGYNEEPSPGIAIGIMLNDEVLLSKGYGLANLEHNIRISGSTVFDIGSVSKQFTAYAIAQLEKEGKLSFDDDIRKYLPKLYDFGQTITLDNLLFHTSGIRGSGILRGYIEGRLEVGKTITQENQLNLIFNQRELNFMPGTGTMYCNSGYILLSKIVEEITEMTLAEYLKQEVFEPLDMHSTLLAGSYEKIILNRAEPYKNENGEIIRAEGMLWEDYGASGIYSTIDDLFKWQRHIHKQKYLLRNDPNNSPVFAMGLMLNRDASGELDEIFHFGSVPGYKTIVSYYPKIKLDVITISNLDNNTDAMLIKSIKNIFIAENNNVATSEIMEVPLEYLKQFEGTYLIMGDNAVIAIEGKNLMAETPLGNLNLIPIGPNEFSMEGTSNKMVFDESLKFFTLKAPGGEMKATLVEENKPKSQYEISLEVFVGDYKSPELEILNRVELNSNDLVITTASKQKIQLKRTGENTFEGIESYYYNKVVFESNNNNVMAFRVSDETGWVQHLLFEKQED